MDTSRRPATVHSLSHIPCLRASDQNIGAFHRISIRTVEVCCTLVNSGSTADLQRPSFAIPPQLRVTVGTFTVDCQTTFIPTYIRQSVI